MDFCLEKQARPKGALVLCYNTQMFELDAITFSFLQALLIGLVIVVVLSIVWYTLSILRKRNDVADLGWATYFIAVAVATFVMHWPRVDLRIVPLLLVLIWGFRLTAHIAARHAKRAEDPRYLAWRTAWGNGFYFYARSYLQVFLFQALLALIITIPLIVLGIFGPLKMTWVYIGAMVWFVGFIFEKTADEDLARFLTHSQAKGLAPDVCQEGLWSYSRHPNYFGEAVQWWGIWLMTIGAPFWGVAIVSPLLITFLLRFVSGVPMTEKSMERLPGFAEYKKKVNIFVPWCKKK